MGCKEPPLSASSTLRVKVHQAGSSDEIWAAQLQEAAVHGRSLSYGAGMSDDRRIGDKQLYVHFITFSCDRRGRTLIQVTVVPLEWIDSSAASNGCAAQT